MYHLTFTDVRKGLVTILADETDISSLKSEKLTGKQSTRLNNNEVDLTKAYMFKGKIFKF